MEILKTVRKVMALKKQADQNLTSWEHVKKAYFRDATLPGLFRIFAFGTETKIDDKLDDAALAALGELKQTIFNASQVLRGAVAIAEGTASQLDGLFEFLDKAEKGSLRALLED